MAVLIFVLDYRFEVFIYIQNEGLGEEDDKLQVLWRW